MWIARKYELEELLYDDNLSLPNSSYYTDLSMRLIFSGVSLRNNGFNKKIWVLQENRKNKHYPGIPNCGFGTSRVIFGTFSEKGL